MHQKITWGIIACGDVTEFKSGPAFNKVPNSSLVAVMRRDQEKLKDYALRHNVPKTYTNADDLINDPEINAIYIATPPSTHELYTIAAINAGKSVYVEKPMTLNAGSAQRMASAAKEKNVKLSVAHYRRALPIFSKIKENLDLKILGSIRSVHSIIYNKPLTDKEMAIPKFQWRVNQEIAGGGIFHDLSPHQLDLLYYFFGEVEKVTGVSTNQTKQFPVDDMVSMTMLFKQGTVFTGVWCFNACEDKDYCEIIGEKGKMTFSWFQLQNPLVVTVDGKSEPIVFEQQQHIQQPMITKVVDYFLSKGPNPCTGEEGVVTMQWMDHVSTK